MKHYKNKFFCFSPPIMAATFLVEMALLLVVLWRYKLNTVGKLAALLLTFLALFQIAEFQVCDAPILGERLIWHQVGYIAITMLPPLGIHLVQAISGKKYPLVLIVSYASAAAFVALFTLVPSVFVMGMCAESYAILRLVDTVSALYTVYYFGLLVLGLLTIQHALKSVKGKTKVALKWLSAGYLVFILPTFLITSLHADAREGIPSIMCGFAVLFAVILGFKIMPLVGKPFNK